MYMPHIDPQKHAEYTRKWLNDPDHPERLEKKKARDKEYYNQNKEKIKTRSKEYYQENRDKVLAREANRREEAKKIIAKARDAPCEDCGIKYPPCVMQFHHLDPSTKKGDVGSTGSPTTAQKEIEKCVVICANCHCIRHDAKKLV